VLSNLLALWERELTKKTRKKVLRACKPPPGRHIDFQFRDHSIRDTPFPKRAVLRNRAPVFNGCRDNWLQTYWGHDLDFSRSRDVIDYVTIRFVIRHFGFPIGGPLEQNLCLQPFSRYSVPKSVNERMNERNETNQPTNKHDGPCQYLLAEVGLINKPITTRPTTTRTTESSERNVKVKR